MKNNKLIIKNALICNPFEKPQLKDIFIEGNKISAIQNELHFNNKNIECIEINVNETIITPGLIDQHTHGGFGVNYNSCSEDSIIDIFDKYPEFGITSVVPTLMTDKKEIIKGQINKIKSVKKKLKNKNSKLLGVHLEGPFLNPKNKGIHPNDDIQLPTIQNFKYFEDEIIKIVTYAPELDENMFLTKYLKDKGIISSAGHSQASSEIIKNAQANGLSQLTHIFNAMSPLHHRKPAIVGEGLVNNELYVEVIADELHLHPIILEIIFRTKPKDKIVFISDSLPLAKSNMNSILFGGQEIYNCDNNAVNKDGTFAGSLIFLDDILRKLSKGDLSKFVDILPFATINPAKNLGLEKLGLIKEGYFADLVFWNRNLEIIKTIINGEISFQK